MAHTQGPWAYDPDTHHVVSQTEFEEWSIDIEDEKPTPKRIICCYGAMGENNVENLSLMVASPIMFRTIEVAKAYIEKCPDIGVKDDMLRILDEVLRAATSPAPTI